MMVTMVTMVTMEKMTTKEERRGKRRWGKRICCGIERRVTPGVKTY